MPDREVDAATSWLTGEVRPTTSDLEPIRGELMRDLGSRYDIRGYLGRGGYATVWQAYDRSDRRFVAIKRFEARSVRTRDFYRELSVLFRLTHPNLVRVVNLLEADSGIRYLFLEYCAGGTLRTVLSKARRAAATCPPHRLRELGLQLGDALKAAHALGIVHRDVKPENVLFESESRDRFGQPSAVKLADFGLARLLDAEARGSEASLRISGSPAYMAPEQFQGQFSPASDLYSLGVVLYELLIGQVPFEGSVGELAKQHLQATPNVPATLPAPWNTLLPRLLEKRPEQRPTLDEFLAILSPGASLRWNARSSAPREGLNMSAERLRLEQQRLSPLFAQLAALRPSARPDPVPRTTEADLQEAYHPSMDRMMVWEPADEETPPAVPTEAVPTEATATDSPHPAAPREGSDAEEATGRSVEDVFGQFDWR